ncbi:unnamed protein product, partial [Brenthis ino]
MSESKPRKRGSTWDEDSLRRAMEAVQNNQLNTNAAALKFNIPRRTLRNHLVSGNSTKIIGKTTILTKQLEEDISQRIKRFAKLGVPLTPKFIRKQAFLFCERFKIKHSFNMSTRMAGRKWLKMFLARNPSISKRKPQLMNPARAQKMNKPIVKNHFEEVKKLYEELDIIAHPERLYNMDEKGCRITVHKQTVVLAEKGNTRVHLVNPEHAENVTIAMCVNAVGIAIPPMIIFKGIRRRSELASNLPPRTKVSMAPKGSMTSSLFVEFIQHLAQHKVPATGLYPLDPDVIPEDAYAPSIVTERPLSETLQQQIDQPLISVQVSPPVSEFKKVSELSSQSLIDERRSAHVSNVSSIFPSTSTEKIVSTSPKFSAATAKRKPVLVSYSSSTDASDLEVDITINDQCRPMLLSSVHRFNVADTKHDPQPSLYDYPLPNNYMTKLQVSDLYTSSSSFDDDLEQKKEITPKKRLIQNKSSIKTKPQLKSHETRSSDDDEPLINLIEDKEKSFHAFLPTPNYATIKSSRSRQKAINYKGQRIVKDLFKTEEKKNEMKQATIPQENSKRSKIEMKKSAEGEEKEWYCHACGENRMEDMRQCTECQKWYHEECMGLTKKDLKFICPDCD